MGQRFDYRTFLPEFPRTPHLPYQATNLDDTDIVASVDSASVVFAQDTYVDEKVDGANLRVCFFEDHFYVGNRRTPFGKGRLPKNPSGLQFKPLWNWLHENKKLFEVLNTVPPFGDGEPATVYAEWLWMAHGMKYDSLPSYFMAFDVYDSTERQFLHPIRAKLALEGSGFVMPRRLYEGPVSSYAQLTALMDRRSGYSSKENQEGIYVKVPTTVKRHVTIHRYKMVRPDFPRGQYFGEEIVRNGLVRADPV